VAEKPAQKLTEQETAFNQQLNSHLTRKIKAQGKVNKTIWLGLGMMGLVGWSVAVPTLLGAMLGIWIDSHYHSPHSWTLMLLMLGLILGCVNAWHWVEKEDREMHKQHEDQNE
jgi:ATP synthase protein I